MGMINEIRSFRGEFAFLSNFFPCKVSFDGLEYTNLESAFQSAKCVNLAERIPFQSIEPSTAKKLGRTVVLRSDWEKVSYLY